MTLNIWRRKTYFFADEKENEENIRRRIIYFFAEKKKHGEGKSGIYLEKENILFAEEKEKGEGTRPRVKCAGVCNPQATTVLVSTG